MLYLIYGLKCEKCQHDILIYDIKFNSKYSVPKYFIGSKPCLIFSLLVQFSDFGLNWGTLKSNPWYIYIISFFTYTSTYCIPVSVKFFWMVAVTVMAMFNSGPEKDPGIWKDWMETVERIRCVWVFSSSMETGRNIPVSLWYWVNSTITALVLEYITLHGEQEQQLNTKYSYLKIPVLLKMVAWILFFWFSILVTE